MRRIFTVVGVLFTAACAGHLVPNYPATVTAARDVPSANKGATFAIATQGATAEAIDIVRSGLEGRGMKFTPEDQADLLVTVEYSRGAPVSVREMTSAPVYRRYSSPGYTTRQLVGTDKEGRPIYTPVTVSGTTTEVYVGENLYCASTTLYDKRMRLSARPTGRASSAVAGWEVTVALRDNIADAAKYAPMLARAAVTQAGDSVRAGTPVLLVNGGRKVKAQKVKEPATQPDTDSARLVGDYRHVGGPCGSDNPTPNPSQETGRAGDTLWR